jgi:hypothetical protein
MDDDTLARIAKHRRLFRHIDVLYAHDVTHGRKCSTTRWTT